MIDNFVLLNLRNGYNHSDGSPHPTNKKNVP